MIIFLTLNQVINIHEHALKFGGLSGIRDKNALESAIEMPKMTMYGEYLHPTLCDKAAAYLYHIVQNHPFLDGNKRTGAASAQLFLRINNIRDNIPDDDYENFVVEIARGTASKAHASAFFRHFTEISTT